MKKNVRKAALKKKALRRTMSVLLSAALVFGAVTASPAVAEQIAETMTVADESEPSGAVTYVYGDVNGSGDLEVTDALLILKHVVKLEDLSKDALIMELADVDHKDSITVADALMVLKCVVRLAEPEHYTVLPEASVEPVETVKASEAAETVAPIETPIAEATETDATAAPVVTELVEQTDVPTETDAPTVTPVAEETNAPDETTEPTAVTPTDTPAAPEVTESPIVTEEAETSAPAVTPDVTEVAETDAPTVEVTAAPTITETTVPTAEATVEPTATSEVTETAMPSAEPTPTPHVHDYTSTITREATCGAEGVMTYTCLVCGNTYTETISAIGAHNYTSTVTQEATCGAEGAETFTCLVCGETFVKPIEATGEHDYVKTEEQVYVVDEAAYDEEVTTKTYTWTCACGFVASANTSEEAAETFSAHLYYEVNGTTYWDTDHYHYAVRPEITTTTETVHHDEVGHYKTNTSYVCSVCGATPEPTACEHVYEKVAKTITVVDEEAQSHVKTAHTVWKCICGEKFDSSEGFTVYDLNAHWLIMETALRYHESATHEAEGYTCTYDDETDMYTCTCDWSHYTGCIRSSSSVKYTYEDIPAVTHEETEYTYICSICGNVKEYVDSDTCEHEWCVAREAWDEDVEETHLFCACGYDCGIYETSDEKDAASDALDAHREPYDLSTILADHNNNQTKAVTVPYPHEATYRCALCGAYKDAE